MKKINLTPDALANAQTQPAVQPQLQFEILYTKMLIAIVGNPAYADLLSDAIVRVAQELTLLALNQIAEMETEIVKQQIALEKKTME